MSETAGAPRTRTRSITFCRDFGLGLALYAILLTGAIYLPDARAAGSTRDFTSTTRAISHHVTFAALPGEHASAALRAADTRQATLILGITFATLTAFNLAVLRHLRRVYASPR